MINIISNEQKIKKWSACHFVIFWYAIKTMSILEWTTEEVEASTFLIEEEKIPQRKLQDYHTHNQSVKIHLAERNVVIN